MKLANYKITSTQLSTLGVNLRNTLSQGYDDPWTYSLYLPSFNWLDIEEFASSGIYESSCLPAILKLKVGEYSRYIWLTWDLMSGGINTEFTLDRNIDTLHITGVVSKQDLLKTGTIKLTLTGTIPVIYSCLEYDLVFDEDEIEFSRTGDYQYELL